MDNRDHFRDFQNTLRSTLSQPISQEHPISLEQLASGVSSHGFFARNLSALRGHEVISNSKAIEMLSKNNFELFDKINDLFIKSQQPENSPPMQKSNPYAEFRSFPQYNHDIATLYQLVKLINKPKISNFAIEQKKQIEQRKQTEIVKIKETLKNATGAIVLLARKQEGVDRAKMLEGDTSAYRETVEKVMIQLRTETISRFMTSADEGIRKLPECEEKETLIKEYMHLADLLKSNNLVKDAKPLLDKDTNKLMTQEVAIRNVVSNFTNVFGDKNPFNGGNLTAINVFEQLFRELARLNPKEKLEIETISKGIQEFGNLCSEFKPLYEAASSPPPVPITPMERAKVQNKLDDLKEEIIFEKNPQSIEVLLSHYRLRLKMAEERLNELP